MTYIKKKTPEEIKIMAEGGKRLSRVLGRLKKYARPGVGTAELDELAKRWLEETGAEPSFLHYQTGDFSQGYPCSLCISLNREIVHGLAIPNRELREGDLVSLDFGARYEGLYTDMATTFFLGRPPKEIKKLIEVTYGALKRALRVVRPGNHLRDVGRTIEAYVKPFGYGIVRDLFGHGVGYKVHESPRVPNYDDPSLSQILLEPGLCLAIEPMLTLGDSQIETLDDGWTIVTLDRSLSAHAEVTVAVTERGCKVLTPFID
jgi:methionyl aminopeptidase